MLMLWDCEWYGIVVIALSSLAIKMRRTEEHFFVYYFMDDVGNG